MFGRSTSSDTDGTGSTELNGWRTIEAELACYLIVMQGSGRHWYSPSAARGARTVVPLGAVAERLWYAAE